MSLSISEQRFKKDVLEAGVPVLVNFWAPWCGVCHLIHPMLNQFHAQFGDRVRLVDINADESLKLASTYRLTTLPTLLLFDGYQVVERIEGFHGRDTLRNALSEIAQRYHRDRTIAVSSP
ncbi:MAG: thioredoxin fold domain-containing protein [Cyanobacteria bacterium SID2]|nr:thioredoxin fold domain-containing protein [Cyanobacteria bacterium SID2]MBP0002731.1 thioredoxin fold domain-containing protein [Cyanobacteria bacterium SBC]